MRIQDQGENTDQDQSGTCSRSDLSIGGAPAAGADCLGGDAKHRHIVFALPHLGDEKDDWSNNNSPVSPVIKFVSHSGDNI